MANIQLINTFTIGQHFACVLEYGDYGVMSDDEIAEFDQWFNDNELQGCTFQYSDNTEFARCEITRLSSECTELSVYKDIK